MSETRAGRVKRSSIGSWSRRSRNWSWSNASRAAPDLSSLASLHRFVPEHLASYHTDYNYNYNGNGNGTGTVQFALK